MRYLTRLGAGLALALSLFVVDFSAAPALADTLTAKVYNGVSGRFVGTNDLGTVISDFAVPSTIDLANGTSANQADLIFADQRTLAASATENLDLAAVLTDPHGNTLTFATVKVIYVKAASANTNNVNIGGAAINTFAGPFLDATDKAGVKPGGAIVLVAPGTGWTVTAATGDILLVANSGAGTSVTYDIIIVGTSA